MRLSLLVAVGVIAAVTGGSPAEGGRNVIPENQPPVLKVFLPPAGDVGGRFVVFTRGEVGEEWDFIADAWECIPSRPDIPITKRVEFCHSLWNASPLLDTLTADDSHGMYPRFVKLQVDSGDDYYRVNLYDIDYRTWQVRCIWQGKRLGAFGVLGDSIWCSSSDGWFAIDAASGEIDREPPFHPVKTDGDFWLVRKPGESEGCWSYDRIAQRFVSPFGPFDASGADFVRSKLSPDGHYLAWLVASAPDGWRGGKIGGLLVVQRSGDGTDVSIPIEMEAVAGSGVRVLSNGARLQFVGDTSVQFRAVRGDDGTEERVWTVDAKTGEVQSDVESGSQPAAESRAVLDGVFVPEDLRPYVEDLTHFGRNAIAPAFLLHMGILKELPGYPDCCAGVSPDGRHVLFRAREGPLAGEYIYGDLLTRKVVRWKAPTEIHSRSPQEFVWVETPE